MKGAGYLHYRAVVDTDRGEGGGEGKIRENKGSREKEEREEAQRTWWEERGSPGTGFVMLNHLSQRMYSLSPPRPPLSVDNTIVNHGGNRLQGFDLLNFRAGAWQWKWGRGRGCSMCVTRVDETVCSAMLNNVPFLCAVSLLTLKLCRFVPPRTCLHELRPLDELRVIYLQASAGQGAYRRRTQDRQNVTIIN